MVLRKHSSFFYNNISVAFTVCFGIVAGYFIGNITRFFVVLPCRTLRGFPLNHLRPLHDRADINADKYGNVFATDDNLVLIGVMTAKRFLRSRAVAAHDTWVKSIPGTVIFFSSEGSEKDCPSGLPVVGLKNVDDSYPPQKKSFMMLKYMHDHFLDRFKFFMRADDDVYVRGDTLRRLLHSVNASQPLFIGQAGLGNKEEFGMLHLKTTENFCMGGTSMILSQETLAKTVPHISHCIKNMYTTHEDVEIGRCISKFAGVSCTWAYEAQKIFYNNYREPKGSFTHSLKDHDIHNAATLHPIKNSTYQYRLHQYFLSMKTDKTRNRLSRLQREINAMNEELQDRDDFYSPSRFGLVPSLLKILPRQRDDVISWDFLSKAFYSAWHMNPRRGLEVDQRTGFEDNVIQVMEMINRNSRQKGRTIDFKEILYAYNRVNPLHGADYVLDLLLVYRKFKGKRKMTVPVRRHAYLQRAFLEVEFKEDLRSDQSDVEVNSVNAEDDTPAAAAALSLLNIREKIGSRGRRGTEERMKDVRVNFILPLSGRYKTFLQFMHNFEDVCLSRNENASLVVVLFRSDQDDRSAETVSFINALSEKYPESGLRVELVDGMFSRGVALQRGSSMFADDDLLFFIDVDMYVHSETLLRIRVNTIRGKCIYYPIVFSQYDPQLVCEKGNTSVCLPRTSPFAFDSQNGYWRQFGFGISAVYNADFRRIGGFDLDIKGWGKEDVNLVEKFVSSNVSIFRSVDIGLVHIFHSIVCDPNLDPSQYQMCLGSKAASYASTEKLASFVYKNAEIFHRNERSGKIQIQEQNAGGYQENGDS